ncbi:HtaA domain-containing protein [Streptomyces sp. M19]
MKKSFRDYVTGPIAGGKVDLTDGAKNQGDTFRFPGGHGSYDATDKKLDAAFDGAVRFTGHDGALDLKFSDLRVTAEGTRARSSPTSPPRTARPARSPSPRT